MASSDIATDAAPDFTHLWAKTDQKNPAPDRYHALALHLVDVAAVTLELWRTSTSPSRRRQWITDLGVDDDLAGRWLAFIAGCHDLGKASVTFQELDDSQLNRVVRATGIAVRTTKLAGVPTLPHGQVTAGELGGILTADFGLDRLAANRLAVVTGGHHGSFAHGDQASKASSRQNPDAVGTGVWATWRSALIDYLARALELPRPLPNALKTRMLSYPSALRLAGLVSLSDWIGSDEHFFPLTATVPDDPRQAFRTSKGRAGRALRHHGWLAPSATIPAASLSDTFPWLTDAKAGQVVAMEVMAGTDGPGIAVVEYPMGWGKTEIALWAAARWAAHDGIDGFYVAMPTRTTSDQLFARTEDLFARHLGSDAEPPNLRRVSGRTRLSTSIGVDSVPPSQGETPSDGDTLAWDIASGSQPAGVDREAERRQRSSWFERRNRGLLARYGVGTIDQAMLGVLQSRHYFVRLEGLGGKTVIFDEVHSYDIYMAEIVDELLRWLGALGSPVVILTATLPRQRTRELISAYRTGAGWSEIVIELEPYPRLTVGTAVGVISRHVEPAPNDVRTVSLVRLPSRPGDDAAMWVNLAGRLSDRLADGGTAAVICNTVAQAQDAFRALDGMFGDDELELFHARFRQRERREIQERVLLEFGKDTHDKHKRRIRPRRKVVVATQVIEQSLDLDFDLMVSMFCPTDLLLQRSGRLHRHHRTHDLRPPGLKEPELWLIGYGEGNGPDPVPAFHRGSEAVYQRFPLLRSWWALRGRDQVVVPADIEQLIEATYSDGASAPVAGTALGEAWESARRVFVKQVESDVSIATRVRIPSLTEDDPVEELDALAAETGMRPTEDGLDPEVIHSAIRTRLGPQSIDVIILTESEASRFNLAPNCVDSVQPGATLVEELLDRSVGISLRGAVKALRESAVPRSWADIPVLRNARLVFLDARSRQRLTDGYTIELTLRLGVSFEREDLERGIGRKFLPDAQQEEEE